MRGIRSISSLVCALLQVSAAQAGSCAKPIDIEDYRAHGGELVHASPIILYNCDRYWCYGRIRFSYVVDTGGRVRDVKLLLNTWRDRPKQGAREFRTNIEARRYKPPVLSGHAVCVRLEVEMSYPGREVWTP